MRCVEDPHDELHFLRLHLLAMYKEHQMEWNIMRNYISKTLSNVARGTDIEHKP